MRSKSRLGHASRGQSAVEFALILPVFILILLVGIDFGRLFFTYVQLSNTAREGAAFAAANPTTDNATLTTVATREANVQAQRGQGVVAATSACVDSSGTTLTCSAAQGGSGGGNQITVQCGREVHLPHSLNRQLLAGWLAGWDISDSGRDRLRAGWRHSPDNVHDAAGYPELHVAKPRPGQQALPHFRQCRSIAEPGEPVPERGLQLELRRHE